MLRKCGRVQFIIRRGWSSLALLGLLLASGTPVALAAPLRANTGTILSLVGIGAGNPGDPIQISSSVQADSDIQRSNLLYGVYAPDGSLVATRKIDANRLDPGDIVNDSWNTSNTPSSGTYSVTLCWSTGNAENCDIASATTGFYSVPTAGVPLSLVGLALIVTFAWRRRHQFEGVVR